VRLFAAVLGFLLKQFGKLIALVLVMFVVYLIVQTVIPALRETAAERERLQEVAAERAAIEDDLAQLRRASEQGMAEAVESLDGPVRDRVLEAQGEVAAKKDQLDDLRNDRDKACGFWDKVIAVPLPGNYCKAAERAVEKADEALDTLESGLQEAEDRAAILADPDLTPEQKLDQLGEDGGRAAIDEEIAATESDLARKEAEEADLREAQDSWSGWVVNLWLKSWKWLVALAVLLLLAPSLLRALAYFVLMPLVARIQKPVRLADDRDDTSATLTAGEARRTLPIRIGADEVLFARSEYVRPVSGGRRRSQLLYDWSAPFISFAAGLHGLTRITGDEDGASTTLATPDDPDSYLMRIDFADHPGLVMRPSHVVGVMGHPELRTRWRWGIQAFATWQVRYVMFAGTGSVIVQGSGDAATATPGPHATRMDQHLVMGFDSRLTMSVNRTEVFLPYLLGRTPLVDDEFSGPHLLFWQKSSNTGPRNPIARTFDAFFSAIGKLLGF
jgi:hypothetical protein